MTTTHLLIQVRHPRFNFGISIPNHWMNGDSVSTHLSYVFHAAIPAGERFIIRVASNAVKESKDMYPEVKTFLGQEGQHASAHDLFTKRLEANGYNPVRIARAHDRMYKWIERIFPSSVCLAMAAAIEHYTADLGYAVLAHPEAFDGVEPEIAKLLLWHAAEEVEHRSVVFDVLQQKYPYYFLRMLGFVLASILLVGSTFVSFLNFVLQDHELSIRPLVSDYRRGFRKIPMARPLIRLVFSYSRPGFHPSQGGDIKLAQQFLSQMSTVNA